MVGTYNDASGVPHGFTWSAGGGHVTLDDPAGTKGTMLSGINDLGQIVGTYIDASGAFAFVYSGGVFATLDGPLGFAGFPRPSASIIWGISSARMWTPTVK